MKNIFACVGGYGGYEHIMYEHLSSIGVNHLQIPAPSPSEVEGVKGELDGRGDIENPQIGRLYTGPYILQPEGVRGEELTEAQTKKRIEKSFEHLRQLGYGD